MLRVKVQSNSFTYLKSLGTLFQGLLPPRAKGTCCYVLYVPLVDQALPVPLDVSFLHACLHD